MKFKKLFILFFVCALDQIFGFSFFDLQMSRPRQGATHALEIPFPQGVRSHELHPMFLVCPFGAVIRQLITPGLRVILKTLSSTSRLDLWAQRRCGTFATRST